MIEIAGRVFTNNIAILSDAMHDFGDSVSLGIAWYFEKYSKKDPDSKFTYAYARFSLVGVTINSLVLVAGFVWILVQVIPRLQSPTDVNAKGMLLISIVGIIINGLAVLRLRK